MSRFFKHQKWIVWVYKYYCNISKGKACIFKYHILYTVFRNKKIVVKRKKVIVTFSWLFRFNKQWCSWFVKLCIFFYSISLVVLNIILFFFLPTLFFIYFLFFYRVIFSWTSAGADSCLPSEPRLEEEHMKHPNTTINFTGLGEKHCSQTHQWPSNNDKIGVIERMINCGEKERERERLLVYSFAIIIAFNQAAINLSPHKHCQL